MGTEPAASSVKDALCGYCGHPRSQHCKSGVRHIYYKHEMRMIVEGAHVTVCTTRHCENALCDCSDFCITQGPHPNFRPEAKAKW